MNNKLLLQLLVVSTLFTGALINAQKSVPAFVYNNSKKNVWIGEVGSPLLTMIPHAGSTGDNLLPNNYVSISTPAKYLIYAHDNASGQALYIDYKTASNHVKTAQNLVSNLCHARNGHIDTKQNNSQPHSFIGTAYIISVEMNDNQPLGLAVIGKPQ